ncbi:MAG: GNAT family N-acetyltransferase [Bacteroidetes bacterium]|nr:GNAT family N-acetyltransferase [Bacteroidota bacterium]
MSLQPTYRQWTLDDTNDIQKVLFNTWLASYADFIPITDIQWYFNNYYSEINFAQLFDDPKSIAFVSEVKGHIVGYARMKINTEQQRCYLESLYVLPEFQGKGIGSGLLQHVERKAVDHSFRQIWLGVMEQNVPSLEWYKKLGFTFVEQSPFQMGKTTVNHFVGYRDIKL